VRKLHAIIQSAKPNLSSFCGSQSGPLSDTGHKFLYNYFMKDAVGQTKQSSQLNTSIKRKLSVHYKMYLINRIL